LEGEIEKLTAEMGKLQSDIDLLNIQLSQSKSPSLPVTTSTEIDVDSSLLHVMVMSRSAWPVARRRSSG
jgi:hypothetical protein